MCGGKPGKDDDAPEGGDVVKLFSLVARLRHYPDCGCFPEQLYSSRDCNRRQISRSIVHRKPDKSLLLTLVLAQLLFSTAFEFTHIDNSVGVGGAQSSIRSHDCRGDELHIPLSALPHCVACSQSSTRVCTEATASRSIASTCVCITSLSREAPQIITADLYHSGKRGPPL